MAKLLRNYSLCVILAMILAVPVYAGGWQGYTQVNQIIVEGSEAGDRVYVVPASYTNPDQCTGHTGYYRIDASTKKDSICYL